jgi:adenylate cyclase
VDELLETSDGPSFQGEKRKVSILMTGIRGFTSLSERLLPEQVVEILNLFLGTMVSAIDQFDGTVDEFIGDAILVIFGAPVWREDDSERAVACAIAMQNAMTSINRQLKTRGLPKIEMGIGINTGEVVVGNIGSLDRSKYGVVGRHVNLAARIESCTVGGQILVSENTRNDVGAILKVGSEAQVSAKGFEDPIVLFEVLGIGGKYNINMPERKDAWRDLAKEVPLVCTFFEGKIAGDRVFEGVATRLSGKAIEVRVGCPIAPLTNLRIQILDSDGEVLFGEVYGKVVAAQGRPEGTARVHFTDISQEAIQYLRGIASPPGGLI